MQNLESSVFMVVALTMLGLFLSISHLADREELFKWLTLIGLIMADLCATVIGGLLVIAGLLTTATGSTTETPVLPLLGSQGAQPMPEMDSLMTMVPALGAVIAVLGLAGLVLLLKPIRRLLARLIPIDPDKVVHTSALHFVLLLIAVSAVTAVAVSLLLTDDVLLDQMAEASAEGGLIQLWAQGLGFVILGFLGVGLFVSRDWRESMERLGLTRHISVRWWLGVTVLGILSGVVVDLLWSSMQPDSLSEVERLTDALFGPYFEAGLLGALTIGLSAGIGEEIVFRGAAQKRLGLIFTSILFTVLHLQYTVSPALIQILVLGLLLGMTRRRANTTTAIAAHASYNFLLVAIGLYFPELGQ